jgi:diguanylate cyclase (GGDEF)-like protein
MNEAMMKRYKYFDDHDPEYSFDPLTKVLNRQEITGFIEWLIQENVPFTASMSDIDNFKNVNDGYGHMIGDDVLEKIGKTIEDVIGSYGLVGRYGGDEFLIVLPYITEYNDVWSIFHNLNLRIPNVKYDRVDELSVTITSGISRFPMDGKTYNEIVSTSDKALYRGKMKGRNCFIIYLAAKHANILLKTDNEKTFSSMETINKVMGLLTKKDSLKNKIESIVKFFTFGMMMDYVGIQGKSSMLTESYYKLCKVKSFGFIPNEFYQKEMNSIGLMFLNDRKTLVQIGDKELHERLKSQDVKSVFAYSIQCENKCYGTFVVYSNQGRIWQSKEMDLFVIAANLIALELKELGKTLEDIL